MKQIDKNTVSAKNQLKEKVPIFYINQGGAGKKILFVGNSITRHGYKPDIGWHGDYGMAASSEENDYVHLVMKESQKKYPDATGCILQVSDWESNYAYGQEIIKRYVKARDFDADVIIMRLAENCDWKNFDSQTFSAEYKELIDYLNVSGTAKIILTTSFWKHVADKFILKIGKERGYQTIYLGDLGEDEDMKAIGKFEHEGVANHPGDLGMQTIARRILEQI